MIYNTELYRNIHITKERDSIRCSAVPTNSFMNKQQYLSVRVFHYIVDMIIKNRMEAMMEVEIEIGLRRQNGPN